MITNRIIRTIGAFILAAVLTFVGVILWCTSIIALGDYTVTSTWTPLLQAFIGSALFVGGCALAIWTYEKIERRVS